MPEIMWALGGVCRYFCELRGGYAGTFVSSGWGMPEPLWARGGYARTVGGLGVRMPELLGAFGLVCREVSRA